PAPGHSRGPAFYVSRPHDGLGADAQRWERQFTGFLPVDPDTAGLPASDGFTNEIAHFVACCRSGAEPLSSGRDNLGTMAVIFGIYESAQRGGAPVDVGRVLG
ncbi:MAG: hypothetical protein M1298_02470, partial [Chloroflexi bacterium]|nr:hypothetical protein [Chloroflexota bacterium]